jgi:hypothetical protein
MLYDIGLICTIVLGLWMLVDVASARPRRIQALPMVLLGGSSALWAGGELLITNAAAPEEVLLGRRLLYLGAAILPIAWAWTAADAARARWIVRTPWLVAVPAIPQLMIYALLFTEAHAWFVHGTAWPPAFGPLYWPFAAVGWSLATLATGYFLLAAVRLGKASPMRMLAIVAGSMVPLLANLLYLTTSKFQTSADPTRGCWSRASRTRSLTPTPPPPASLGSRSWLAGLWGRCWRGCNPTARARSRWRGSP